MESLWLKMEEWVAFYGLKVIAALAIFIVGRWIAQAIQALTTRVMTKRKVDPTVVSFVGHLVYIALLTFVVIAALAQLGIQTTSFIAVIGAAGLAIGLALQGSLSNFAAGFLMILFKPFKAGDYIEGGGATGTVEKIEVFTTTLVTVDNKVIIVPNSKMMGDSIVNYSKKETRRVDLDFGVSYGDGIDRTRACLREVVDGDARSSRTPLRTFRKELAENRIVFRSGVVKGTDYWGFISMSSSGEEAFEARGSRSLPRTDVHLYEPAG